MAQCLFFRTHRPIAALLMGEEEFRKLDAETLTDHVTAASLAMIEGAGFPLTPPPPSPIKGEGGASN